MVDAVSATRERTVHAAHGTETPLSLSATFSAMPGQAKGQAKGVNPQTVYCMRNAFWPSLSTHTLVATYLRCYSRLIIMCNDVCLCRSANLSVSGTRGRQEPAEPAAVRLASMVSRLPGVHGSRQSEGRGSGAVGAVVALVEPGNVQVCVCMCV